MQEHRWKTASWSSLGKQQEKLPGVIPHNSGGETMSIFPGNESDRPPKDGAYDLKGVSNTHASCSWAHISYPPSQTPARLI